MRLAKVRKAEAEAVRKRLFAIGAVRKDLSILEAGESVFIPLKAYVDERIPEDLGIEIVEGTSPERSCHRSPYERVLESAVVPEDLKYLLPDKWERIGDVLILKIPTELEPYGPLIAESYAEAVGTKTVCEDLGKIIGPYRTPNLKVIFGKETETIHLENGIRYKLDVAKLMFSSGNVDERKRMGELDCEGETVVDMFAGIGYFTLPIAVHAKAERVIACEINPLAHRYLKENLALNGVEGKVDPFLGDNRDLPGEAFADRVVMGYVGTTHEYLPKAMSLVRPGGVVHYHETCPIDLLPGRPIQRIAEAAAGREHRILTMREVKSYGPSTIHVAVEFELPD
ncbi:MAG: class I SAM-dependent methyltransferase family protein [Euryarchaeota archaeon]|nr:class I SAM-dependent methyltransferase family protein [Euryarchaeota archaeon]